MRKLRYFFFIIIIISFFGTIAFGAFLEMKSFSKGSNPQSFFGNTFSFIGEKNPENKTAGVANTNNENNQTIEKSAPIEDKKSENTEIDESGGQKEESGFSFAVIGDTQRFDFGNSNGGIQQAVKNILNFNPNLVLAMGDLVSSCDGKEGCREKLNEWKGILGSLFPKTYATMGNHDRTGKEKADKMWQDFFNFPAGGPSGYNELTYSFNYSNSHFIVLDSENPEEHVINKTQRDWLDNDLAKNGKENNFVFFHEPAFPVSSKIGESLDVNKNERDAFWGILKKYKITAVFSGHEHICSRRKVDGIYQIVIGNTDSFDHDSPQAGLVEYSYRGKHFAIVEVNGKSVIVKIYSVEGKLLNTFAIP